MEAYNAVTEVLTIHPNTPEPQIIAQAAGIIRAGGLVAFPTETVYGLGANAFDAAAIERIYRAKQRPSYDPVIVHITHVATLQTLALDLPDIAYALAEAFWPGALTLVLQRAPNVPPNVATGLLTVAVRMPAHPVARALIDAAGVPIAAPSANRFTRPSATQAAHVLEDLNGHVDLVLDGGQTRIGIESTVLDLTQAVPTVLRPGGIVMDELRQVIPQVQIMNRLIADPMTPTQSPGMAIKHYSPRAELILFDGERDTVLNAMNALAVKLTHDQKRVGILTTDEDAGAFTHSGARILSLGQEDNLDHVAHVLFGAMRALDNQNVDKILVRAYAKDGLGAAIWDRLLRAAEGKVRRMMA